MGAHPTPDTYHRTHGKTRLDNGRGPINPTYLTWQRMKSRCQNRNDQDYRHYGGRGITVCERWQKFENFLADMGERTREQQIERIDNNGNYEPDNCRWATKKENARNRRNSVMVTVDGVTHIAAEWDELMGLPSETVWNRLDRGWSHDRAVKTPLDTRYSR